jgi:hypothetical protein
VASLLLVHWWPRQKISYEGKVVTLAELENRNINTIEIAAELWASSVNAIFNMREKIGDRYKEVFYEDLVRDTNNWISEILIHCELSQSMKFTEFINSFSIENRNFKYKEQLNTDEIGSIEDICRPILSRTTAHYFD